MRTALVIDVQSIYRAVNYMYGNKIINYLDLVKWLEDEYKMLFVFKFAYGKQDPERALSFITLMRANGFNVNIGNNHWNTELGVQTTALLPNVEAIVLCSSYYEHGAVLKHARSQGKLTYVICPDKPNFFKNLATIIELPKTMLRDRKPHESSDTTKQMELPAHCRSDDSD